MAWGFRKTFKIAPGIRLNIGKQSVSARLGPRGAGVTVGTKGARASGSLPGTGLRASTKLGGKPAVTDEATDEPEMRKPSPVVGAVALLIIIGLIWWLL